jgi:WD40 repeat protein
VEYDHAVKVRFSPDSRAFIAGLSYDSTVRVFKLGKKDDGVTTTCVPIEGDFPKYGKSKLLNIGIATNPAGGSFVMTAYEDTTVAVRSLKGDVLHTINTNQSNNNAAWVSRCGRFVASSGWTPDVKVWAVNFAKNGDYQSVTKAFVLSGHTSSVWSFAFNLDSTRMISVSKDGTWRLYDTEIEYEKGQEPYLLKSQQFTVCGFSPTEHQCLVALSSDGCVAAVALLNNLTVFSTVTGEVEMQVSEVHSEIISSISFDIAGKYIITAGDKHIRVFHNTMGYKGPIQHLEGAIKKLAEGSAIRQRQQKMLDDAKNALKKIEDKTKTK